MEARQGSAGPPVIPLDRKLEQGRIAPVAAAIIALVFAFVLFQVVISPVTLLLLLMAQGVAPAALLTGMAQIFEEHARSLLIANTVGQFLGIGLVAFLFARSHSSRPWAFLRVRRPEPKALLLTAIGLVALIPISQFLGEINESIPLPEWLEQMERAQMELIERSLLVQTGLLFNLLVLAVTPAICEELLFRGYVQRQAERGLGVAGGIMFSGLLFGLYHLRLSQLVPLTVVGLYLAYVAWQFRSIWPAVLGHFLFNGFAVAAGAYFSRDGAANVDDIDKMEVPWYLLLSGLVILLAVVRVMRHNGGSEPELQSSGRTVETPLYE